MQQLYCAAAPETDFNFDSNTLTAALKRIYRREIDPYGEIDEGLFREMCGIFNQAADVGFAGKLTDREAEFIDAIRYNNALFSAFKVHRLQGDVGAQLLDEDGRLKPYRQWRNDIQGIVSHHTERWLETEYNTAVKRADLAAEWMQFEREADVLPNLRWVKSLSIEPRESHRIYWGMVLPISHPFWANHRPGDEWGCKCGLEATDDPAAETIPSGKGMDPAPGLNGNPAYTRKLFSDDHPYIANAYGGAAQAVRSLLDRLGLAPEEVVERKFKSGGILQTPAGFWQNSVEQAKNVRAYTELAKMHGERYKLLAVDNTIGKKNPDALNLKTGFYSDMKNPQTLNGKNAMQAAIKSAAKQRVEELYVYLTHDYASPDLYRGMIAGLHGGRAKSLRTIIVRLSSGSLKRYNVERVRRWLKN